MVPKKWGIHVFSPEKEGPLLGEASPVFRPGVLGDTRLVHIGVPKFFGVVFSSFLSFLGGYIKGIFSLK